MDGNQSSADGVPNPTAPRIQSDTLLAADHRGSDERAAARARPPGASGPGALDEVTTTDYLVGPRSRAHDARPLLSPTAQAPNKRPPVRTTWTESYDYWWRRAAQTARRAPILVDVLGANYRSRLFVALLFFTAFAFATAVFTALLLAPEQPPSITLVRSPPSVGVLGIPWPDDVVVLLTWPGRDVSNRRVELTMVPRPTSVAFTTGGLREVPTGPLLDCSNVLLSGAIEVANPLGRAAVTDHTSQLLCGGAGSTTAHGPLARLENAVAMTDANGIARFRYVTLTFGTPATYDAAVVFYVPGTSSSNDGSSADSDILGLPTDTALSLSWSVSVSSPVTAVAVAPAVPSGILRIGDTVRVEGRLSYHTRAEQASRLLAVVDTFPVDLPAARAAHVPLSSSGTTLAARAVLTDNVVAIKTTGCGFDRARHVTNCTAQVIITARLIGAASTAVTLGLFVGGILVPVSQLGAPALDAAVGGLSHTTRVVAPEGVGVSITHCPIDGTMIEAGLISVVTRLTPFTPNRDKSNAVVFLNLERHFESAADVAPAVDAAVSNGTAVMPKYLLGASAVYVNDTGFAVFDVAASPSGAVGRYVLRARFGTASALSTPFTIETRVVARCDDEDSTASPPAAAGKWCPPPQHYKATVAPGVITAPATAMRFYAHDALGRPLSGKRPAAFQSTSPNVPAVVSMLPSDASGVIRVVSIAVLGNASVVPAPIVFEVRVDGASVGSVTVTTTPPDNDDGGSNAAPAADSPPQSGAVIGADCTVLPSIDFDTSAAQLAPFATLAHPLAINRISRRGVVETEPVSAEMPIVCCTVSSADFDGSLSNNLPVASDRCAVYADPNVTSVALPIEPNAALPPTLFVLRCAAIPETGLRLATQTMPSSVCSVMAPVVVAPMSLGNAVIGSTHASFSLGLDASVASTAALMTEVTSAIRIVPTYCPSGMLGLMADVGPTLLPAEACHWASPSAGTFDFNCTRGVPAWLSQLNCTAAVSVGGIQLGLPSITSGSPARSMEQLALDSAALRLIADSDGGNDFQLQATITAHKPAGSTVIPSLPVSFAAVYATADELHGFADKPSATGPPRSPWGRPLLLNRTEPVTAFDDGHEYETSAMLLLTATDTGGSGGSAPKATGPPMVVVPPVFPVNTSVQWLVTVNVSELTGLPLPPNGGSSARRWYAVLWCGAFGPQSPPIVAWTEVPRSLVNNSGVVTPPSDVVVTAAVPAYVQAGVPFASGVRWLRHRADDNEAAIAMYPVCTQVLTNTPVMCLVEGDPTMDQSEDAVVGAFVVGRKVAQLSISSQTQPGLVRVALQFPGVQYQLGTTDVLLSPTCTVGRVDTAADNALPTSLRVGQAFSVNVRIECANGPAPGVAVYADLTAARRDCALSSCGALLGATALGVTGADGTASLTLIPSAMGVFPNSAADVAMTGSTSSLLNDPKAAVIRIRTVSSITVSRSSPTASHATELAAMGAAEDSDVGAVMRLFEAGIVAATWGNLGSLELGPVLVENDVSSVRIEEQPEWECDEPDANDCAPSTAPIVAKVLDRKGDGMPWRPVEVRVFTADDRLTPMPLSVFEYGTIGHPTTAPGAPLFTNEEGVVEIAPYRFRGLLPGEYVVGIFCQGVRADTEEFEFDGEGDEKRSVDGARELAERAMLDGLLAWMLLLGVNTRRPPEWASVGVNAAFFVATPLSVIAMTAARNPRHPFDAFGDAGPRGGITGFAWVGFGVSYVVFGAVALLRTTYSRRFLRSARRVVANVHRRAMNFEMFGTRPLFLMDLRRQKSARFRSTIAVRLGIFVFDLFLGLLFLAVAYGGVSTPVRIGQTSLRASHLAMALGALIMLVIASALAVAAPVVAVTIRRWTGSEHRVPPTSRRMLLYTHWLLHARVRRRGDRFPTEMDSSASSSSSSSTSGDDDDDDNVEPHRRHNTAGAKRSGLRQPARMGGFEPARHSPTFPPPSVPVSPPSPTMRGAAAGGDEDEGAAAALPSAAGMSVRQHSTPLSVLVSSFKKNRRRLRWGKRAPKLRMPSHIRPRLPLAVYVACVLAVIGAMVLTYWVGAAAIMVQRLLSVSEAYLDGLHIPDDLDDTFRAVIAGGIELVGAGMPLNDGESGGATALAVVQPMSKMVSIRGIIVGVQVIAKSIRESLWGVTILVVACAIIVVARNIFLTVHSLRRDLIRFRRGKMYPPKKNAKLERKEERRRKKLGHAAADSEDEEDEEEERPDIQEAIEFVGVFVWQQLIAFILAAVGSTIAALFGLLVLFNPARTYHLVQRVIFSGLGIILGGPLAFELIAGNLTRMFNRIHGTPWVRYPNAFAVFSAVLMFLSNFSGFLSIVLRVLKWLFTFLFGFSRMDKPLFSGAADPVHEVYLALVAAEHAHRNPIVYSILAHLQVALAENRLVRLAADAAVLAPVQQQQPTSPRRRGPATTAPMLTILGVELRTLDRDARFPFLREVSRSAAHWRHGCGSCGAGNAWDAVTLLGSSLDCRFAIGPGSHGHGSVVHGASLGQPVPVSTSGIVVSVVAAMRRRRRARTVQRWWLLCILHANPSLLADRKHRIRRRHGLHGPHHSRHSHCQSHRQDPSAITNGFSAFELRENARYRSPTADAWAALRLVIGAPSLPRLDEGDTSDDEASTADGSESDDDRGDAERHPRVNTQGHEACTDARVLGPTWPCRDHQVDDAGGCCTSYARHAVLAQRDSSIVAAALCMHEFHCSSAARTADSDADTANSWPVGNVREGSARRRLDYTCRIRRCGPAAAALVFARDVPDDDDDSGGDPQSHCGIGVVMLRGTPSAAADDRRARRPMSWAATFASFGVPDTAAERELREVGRCCAEECVGLPH
jgi:hypothetical protein